MGLGLNHYLVLGAVLFCIGLYGALAKRNAVAVLMGIEIMLERGKYHAGSLFVL